jgi:hypothetical protein
MLERGVDEIAQIAREERARRAGVVEDRRRDRARWGRALGEAASSQAMIEETPPGRDR